MCSQPEWTPPSETSPSRCSRPRGLSRARAQAASSASFSKKLPSAIASSIRARSCLTIAPAPRLRWPTSELPIWPTGRPTSGPWAESSVCGKRVPETVEDRGLGERDRVARAGLGEPPAVEDDQRQRGDRVSSVGRSPSPEARLPRRSRRNRRGRGWRRRPGRRRRRAGPAARPRCRASPSRRRGSAPRRPRRRASRSTSRMKAHASWACSGVAVRPVPIAQIGS